MWTDPIVEEVRKYRREIEKEGKGDFATIFANAKKIEKSIKGRLVSGASEKGPKRKARVTS